MAGLGGIGFLFLVGSVHQQKGLIFI